MPFKSEKQRRFLWAEHPDIAKRWAHEYPTKKKLPMYANKKTTHKQSAVNTVAVDIYRKLSKKADTKEVYIEQPASDKPTEAGENPPTVVKTKGERCNSEIKPKSAVNPLMAKLSAVLSQPIMQALENERAEMEAREAARMPANANLKHYAMPAAGTPLPMGMQAAAPQGQPQAPAAQPANMGSPAPSGQLPPVGGGSSPNANPINSYGALSSSGDITGNAAFGTANSVGSEKIAGALGLWDRIRMKRERGGKKAKPGDKDYPDSKSWKKVTSISAEKQSGTPAWQRSAGKNEEGGLNEKGRKSYERETGGNLKAPVTESKPKGDRAKRQNSFCSRMCGMKRVNTGADTKKDPDSRINKSLRKWNCKCSSAYEFGKEAGLNFGGLGRLFGGGAKAVANTAAKAVAPKLNIANVHPSVAGPLAAARGESLMRHPDIMENVNNYLMRASKRPAQPPQSRMRMPGAVPGGFPRFGDTQQARVAMSDAQARFERVMAGMGRRNMSDTQTGEKIRSQLTAWGGPTTNARTWGQLQGITPAAKPPQWQGGLDLSSLD